MSTEDLWPIPEPTRWSEPRPPAMCVGCNKTPAELYEYSPAFHGEENLTNEEYVWREEGTLNTANGHFLCTDCYIKAGQPSGGRGQRWIAP